MESNHSTITAHSRAALLLLVVRQLMQGWFGDVSGKLTLTLIDFSWRRLP